MEQYRQKMAGLSRARAAETSGMERLKSAQQAQQVEDTPFGIGSSLQKFAGLQRERRAQAGLDRARAQMQEGEAAHQAELLRRAAHQEFLREQEAAAAGIRDQNTNIERMNEGAATDYQNELEHVTGRSDEMARREETLRGDVLGGAPESKGYVDAEGNDLGTYAPSYENGQVVMRRQGDGEPLPPGAMPKDRVFGGGAGGVSKVSDRTKQDVDGLAKVSGAASQLAGGLTSPEQVQIGGIPTQIFAEAADFLARNGLEKFMGKYGDQAMRAQRWWSDLQKLLQATERHEMYGAQLTQHEAKYYETGEAMFKGATPQQVKDRIEHLKMIHKRRLAAKLDKEIGGTHGRQPLIYEYMARTAEKAGLNVVNIDGRMRVVGDEVTWTDAEGKQHTGYDTDEGYSDNIIRQYYANETLPENRLEGTEDIPQVAGDEAQAMSGLNPQQQTQLRNASPAVRRRMLIRMGLLPEEEEQQEQ